MQTYKEIEFFFSNLEKLPKVAPPEATIFSIGSKGYYENPTTDILAFFLNDSAEHGLGSLVLEAFLDIVPKGNQYLSPLLQTQPQREVWTKSNKRIDLLLESSDWAMVIENKIYHEQNNPFEDYESFVKNDYPERFKDKNTLFIVLSPSGDVPPISKNWTGISYTNLIKSVKRKLAEQFYKQPLNKWTVLLREFILHMESIVSEPAYPEENISFVLNNLFQFNKAQLLKEQSIKAYENKLLSFLNSQLNSRVTSKLQNWGGSPAIRFAYDSWNTESDVVLVLEASENCSFKFHYYASDVITDSMRSEADSKLKTDDCDNVWNEVKNTFRCYSTGIQHLNEDKIKKTLIEKLELLDSFEKNRH
ncbi:PD-(D/E)XK nuclease family protein [Marinomonas pollencensis]|uniref:PD-(D/E)XK nuclease superfamily protein n=1 Tax=Marinomonas pollencensis TaxID=491954 RepID=A0A3E0DRR3_9GAMM|nr:PD-(D/E)XK nuclease family protein [Marinomonas pollencensis]REG85847.1 PD-(D/E)XK nuclease superfamily protein [Marinomonas pollencensis]